MAKKIYGWSAHWQRHNQEVGRDTIRWLAETQSGGWQRHNQVVGTWQKHVQEAFRDIVGW